MVDVERAPQETTAAPARPLIELDHLTRRYGALVAVDDVSMRVGDGEIRAIIGPNGAGKTTLFHLITGIVKPSAGRPLCGQRHNWTARARHLPARAVAHVPADVGIFRDDRTRECEAGGAGPR